MLDYPLFYRVGNDTKQKGIFNLKYRESLNHGQSENEHQSAFACYATRRTFCQCVPFLEMERTIVSATDTDSNARLPDTRGALPV